MTVGIEPTFCGMEGEEIGVTGDPNLTPRAFAACEGNR